MGMHSFLVFLFIAFTTDFFSGIAGLAPLASHFFLQPKRVTRKGRPYSFAPIKAFGVKNKKNKT